MNITYEFKPEEAFNTIKTQWTKWANDAGMTKFVVGISGGIDSTCVASLACRIFGTENVIGVSLPCDGQSDMNDVDNVFKCLGIRRVDIDIGNAFKCIIDSIENNAIAVSNDTATNLPARLRMSTLYAVSQSIGKDCTVLNTCNISETVSGYDTLFGDSCGSYAPIQELTKTEVRRLARWLGVYDNLCDKVSVDGLQPLTDEQKLGMTYATIDRYIRENKVDNDAGEKIDKRFARNKFKMDIIHVPAPKMDFPNYVIINNCLDTASNNVL